jgi:isopenicillin N synthase-like dioxygenase
MFLSYKIGVSAMSVVAPEESPLNKIPIVDIGPYLKNRDGQLEAVAKELQHAQENVGFYYLLNHGISPELIAAALDQVKQFHALSEDNKMLLVADIQGPGYIPFKSSVYVTSPLAENSTKAPDLNANFRIVRERPLNHPSVVAKRRFAGPNKWPDTELLPNFRSTMLDYFDQLEKLGEVLLPVYARALDLPKNYFNGMFTDPYWTTRNVHYPNVAPSQNQFAAGAHRDNGFITILPVSEIPALEVMTTQGEWIPALHIKDSMLVNSGEFMNNWTNGRFIATPHRVLPPGQERHQIAFFYNPNWDVVSNVLPSCVDASNSSKFEPIQYLEHYCNYVDGNYAKAAGGKLT